MNERKMCNGYTMERSSPLQKKGILEFMMSKLEAIMLSEIHTDTGRQMPRHLRDA